MITIKVRGFLSREPASAECCEEPGTSYQELRTQIEEALQGDEQILLDIDSGGGEAIGVHDLAEFIFANRDRIEGYASGICASAAYHLGSACGKLFANRDAIIGSIGSMMYPPWNGGAIVADLSKNKNTESGIQEIVDESCERFILDVAKYRELPGDLEQLSKQFGEGKLFSASAALKQNLIDGIKTMDDQTEDKLDVEGIAAMLPKVLEKLDEIGKRIDSIDERVGMLERDERIDREEDKGELEKCEPKQAADGEEQKDATDDEEKKKDEETDKMAGVVNCLISTLKRSGHIAPKEESRAIRLLNADPVLFQEIFVEREPRIEKPLGKVSLSQKNKEAPAETRDGRARQMMKATGCNYIEALAKVIEQEG